MLENKSLAKGVVWSIFDKFFIVIFQLLFEIILARLLLPADYGIVAMVTVFIAVAQVFVDGGFMNALIQKQNRTEDDYSTVFYSNIAISLIIYALLFVLSPAIAQFYNVPVLEKIVQIIGINVVLNAISLVYRTKLSVVLDFKKQAFISVISILTSGLTGIVLAYSNYGVWALVWQSILFYGINTFLLVITTQWVPQPRFSIDSFKKLFGFGSKLLAAGILQNIFTNLYSLLIGKVFSSGNLGLYVKANQFTMYPSSVTTNMLQRVLYPYLAAYQHDNAKLSFLNKRYYTFVAMFFFPLFIGLAVLAEPFVLLLFSETWIEVVPMVRVLAIAFLIFPFININMYIFQIKGMSARFLWIEVITKVTGLIILFWTLRYNVLIMCYGILVQHIIQWLVSSYYSDKVLKLKIFSQIRDLVPLILVSIVFSGGTYKLIQLIESPLWQLIIGVLIITMLFLLYYFIVMKDMLVLLWSKIYKKNISFLSK